MYHSIRIGEKDTWNDWHLVPTSRPVLKQPPVKMNLLDITGGNGSIDLSDAITGYPVYGDRSGSLEFAVVPGYGSWAARYSEIAGYLHGRRMRVELEDDRGWYYEGRLSVNEWRSESARSLIVLDYTLGPYAWAQTATNEPWLWDPFSFETGVIGNGVFEAAFSASEDVTATPAELAWTAARTGNAFFHPEFTVTGDADVILEIKAGDETRLQVTLAHGETVSVPRLALQSGRWLYKLEEVRVFASTASGTAALGVADAVSYQGADAFSHIPVTATAAPLAFTAAQTGAAPQKVIFSAAGAAVTLTATTTDASPITFMETIPAGSSAPMTGLVLYRGTWLYNGRPAALTAATASGTATLALTFRPGRL